MLPYGKILHQRADEVLMYCGVNLRLSNAACKGDLPWRWRSLASEATVGLANLLKHVTFYPVIVTTKNHNVHGIKKKKKKKIQISKES